MGKDELKNKLGLAIAGLPHVKAIKSLALFGSHVNGSPDIDSDVDVLIDFFPSAVIGFFELSDIQNHLESAIGMKVDLVTPQAVSKYFRDQVLTQAEVVYEG
ncbi:nucleotidyltransferase family protein [Planctomycetota bacterium]